MHWKEKKMKILFSVLELKIYYYSYSNFKMIMIV